MVRGGRDILPPPKISVTFYNTLVTGRLEHGYPVVEKYLEFRVYNHSQYRIRYSIYVDDTAVEVYEELDPGEYRDYRIHPGWWNMEEGQHKLRIDVVGAPTPYEYDFYYYNYNPNVYVEFVDENNKHMKGNIAVVHQSGAWMEVSETTSIIPKPASIRDWFFYEFWRVNEDGTIYFGLVKDNQVDKITRVQLTRAREIPIECRIPIPKDWAGRIVAAYLGAIFANPFMVTWGLLEVARRTINYPLDYLKIEEDKDNYWIVFGATLTSKNISAKGWVVVTIAPLIKIIAMVVIAAIIAWIVYNIQITVTSQHRRDIAVSEAQKYITEKTNETINNILNLVKQGKITPNQALQMIETVRGIAGTVTKINQPTPTGPSPMEWITYLVYGLIGLGAIAIIASFVRK